MSDVLAPRASQRRPEQFRETTVRVRGSFPDLMQSPRRRLARARASRPFSDLFPPNCSTLLSILRPAVPATRADGQASRRETTATRREADGEDRPRDRHQILLPPRVRLRKVWFPFREIYWPAVFPSTN